MMRKLIKIESNRSISTPTEDEQLTFLLLSPTELYNNLKNQGVIR